MLVTGGALFQVPSGCSEEFARAVAFGIRDVLAAGAISVFDQVVVQPVVDGVVADGEAS